MGHKAILHIYSTFNNVLITATDLTGAETVCKVSGGTVSYTHLTLPTKA